MARLRDEPGLVTSLSRGALARAQELTWDRKVELFATAYEAVVTEARAAAASATASTPARTGA